MKLQNLLLSAAAMVSLMGCAQEQILQQTEKSIEVTSSIPVSIYIQGGVEQRTLSVTKQKIVKATVELTAPDGSSESQIWSAGSAKSLTFMTQAFGTYTLEVTEEDEVGVSTTKSETFDIEAGYNYTIQLTLGGKMTVHITDANTSWITFEKRESNSLNVRQTSASVDSYTIEWDSIAGAEAYNLYRIGAGRASEYLLATVTGTSFEETITERMAYHGSQDDGFARRIYVRPVIGGVESTNDYYIVPVLFDEAELISSDYIDNFSGTTVDEKYQFSYWHSGFKYLDKTFDDGGQVAVTDSGLHMTIKATDDGPALNFVCQRGDAKAVKFSFMANIQRVNDNHYFRISTPYTITGMYHHTSSGKLGIWNWDRNTNYSTDFYKVGDTEIYDSWMQVSYEMKFDENIITVAFGADTYDIPFEFETVQSDIIPVQLSNFGWFTGHTIVIDDLQVIYK